MPRMQRRKMKTAPVETLGARVKRLRLARGLSQPELAALVHVDHATVSRWETDHRMPQRGPRAALASVLGVPVDYLVHGNTTTGHEPMAVADRRRPMLMPLREAVSRVQAIGDEALSDFVADVVALANRWGQRKPR
jgi:transcriptional regulator with XRE-family HTH domain